MTGREDHPPPGAPGADGANAASEIHGAASGFALVAVLVLTVMIMTLVPVMLTLNRENIASTQGDQIKARVSEQARQMFMIGHTTMRMNAGLPLGWQQASTAAPREVALMVRCANALRHDGGGRPDAGWDGANTRISTLTIADDTAAIGGTRLAAGVSRANHGAGTHEEYIILGCAISDAPNPQAAAMLGRFAVVGQRLMLLGLEAR